VGKGLNEGRRTVLKLRGKTPAPTGKVERKGPWPGTQPPQRREGEFDRWNRQKVDHCGVTQEDGKKPNEDGQGKTTLESPEIVNRPKEETTVKMTRVLHEEGVRRRQVNKKGKETSKSVSTRAGSKKRDSRRFVEGQKIMGNVEIKTRPVCSSGHGGPPHRKKKSGNHQLLGARRRGCLWDEKKNSLFPLGKKRKGRGGGAHTHGAEKEREIRIQLLSRRLERNKKFCISVALARASTPQKKNISVPSPQRSLGLFQGGTHEWMFLGAQ